MESKKILNMHTNAASGGLYSIQIGSLSTGTSSTTVGTSTSSSFNIEYEKKLESAKFIEQEIGNVIEMVYSLVQSSSPHITYTYYPYNSTPKKSMIKEIYGVVDGQMVLIQTIKGYEEPGYYVEPTIEWEE